jgi:hypothetical protein
MEKHKGLSQRPLGSDADNLEVTEERPRQEPVNNPPAKETSCIFVSKEDDLEAVRDEMIKVQSFTLIFTQCLNLVA